MSRPPSWRPVKSLASKGGNCNNKRGLGRCYLTDVDDAAQILATQQQSETNLFPWIATVPSSQLRNPGLIDGTNGAHHVAKGLFGAGCCCRRTKRARNSQPPVRGARSSHERRRRRDGDRSRMVTLTVYDLSHSRVVEAFNRAAMAVVDAGLFHVGVVFWQEEFSYGYKETGTGVFKVEPHQDTMHRYRGSVDLGITPFTREECLQVVDRMALSAEWQGSRYDGIKQNCTHFARSLAAELGVPGIPDWVDRFGRKAQVLVSPIDDTLRDSSCCCRLSRHSPAMSNFSLEPL